MAKFKCKLCHRKHKVSSLPNAQKEITCSRVGCPLFLFKTPEVVPKPVKRKFDSVLSFEDVQPYEFQVIEFYPEGEDKLPAPEPVVEPASNAEVAEAARYIENQFEDASRTHMRDLLLDGGKGFPTKIEMPDSNYNHDD